MTARRVPARHVLTRPVLARRVLAGRGVTAVAALAVTLAVVVVAGGLWWIFAGDGARTVTAYFGRAVGVYPGSDVRVLGVRVGEVASVTPQGQQVRVVLTLDAGVAVPADTMAVVLAPSVVADRYVQFTGGSKAGPELADGAVIPIGRTATPVELDELYRGLNDLLGALGPAGANADGSLSRLLDTGAATLQGNGEAFNESVRNLAELARTLGDADEDLFATVDALQRFTAVLAGNDRQVASATERLALVSRTLAADRDELAAALAGLGAALGDIQAFISENRAALQSNVDKLAAVTQLLVDRRASLAEALDVAPLAASNLLGTFDAGTGTLQSRVDLLDYLVSTAGGAGNPATAGGAGNPTTAGGAGNPATAGGAGNPTTAVPLPLPASGGW